MTERHWTGLHNGNPWHWVWQRHNGYSRHGYGPTREAAVAALSPWNRNEQPQPQIVRRF